jgi:hypothetical protein
MKSLNWKMIVGIGLLLLGGLTLLDSLNVIPAMSSVWEWVLACIFGLGGASFLYALVADRQQNWWAAIPGMVLLGLCATFIISFFPRLGDLAGGAFLASISAAFWIVYLLDRKKWWGIIPGGVMATLAVVAAAGSRLGEFSGVLFFLGMSLTFAVLALVPVNDTHMKWPWIPAAALFALASMLALSAENLLQYLWPVGLILVGLFLVGRNFFFKQK